MKKIAVAAASLLLGGTAFAQLQADAGLYSEAGWTHLHLNLSGGAGPGLKASAGLARGIIGRQFHPNWAVEGMLGAGVRHGHTNGVIAGPPVQAPPPITGGGGGDGGDAPDLPDGPAFPDGPPLPFAAGPAAAHLSAGNLTAAEFGATADLPFSARMKVRHILAVFLKPRVQFGGLEVFGRVGYAHTRVRTIVRAQGARRSVSDGDGDFAFGAGVGYQLAPNAYLSLDLMRYHHKGGSKVEGASLGIGTRW